MTTESKCGDSCKLVEMLATKTSKKQAMENAEALYFADPENISIRGAAKQCGVDHSALAKRIKKKSCTVWQEPHHTTQESKPARTKPTDEERQGWWDMHVNDGLTVNAIHKKTGRNRETISKEIKRREEAEGQPEPTPAPEPTPTPSAPAPTPEPEPSKILSMSEKVLSTWNGNLGEHHKKIIRREKPRNRKIQKMAPAITEIKQQIEQTMNAASKDSRNYGAGQLAMYVAVVEKQLEIDGEPGIKESLTQMIHEAERIQKYASEALRLLQLS